MLVPGRRHDERDEPETRPQAVPSCLPGGRRCSWPKPMGEAHPLAAGLKRRAFTFLVFPTGQPTRRARHPRALSHDRTPHTSLERQLPDRGLFAPVPHSSSIQHHARGTRTHIHALPSPSHDTASDNGDPGAKTSRSIVASATWSAVGRPRVGGSVG